MEDRVFDLKGIPDKLIKENGYKWYLGEEYIIPEAIRLTGEEIDAYRNAADISYTLYEKTIDRILSEAKWDNFKFPFLMREMIQHSFAKKHMHLLGRFDFGGGLANLPLGLMEFNADTSTMLPESALFQDYFKSEIFDSRWYHFNFLKRDLIQSFKQLRLENPKKLPTLLVTSLGHQDDQLNCKVIVDAATEAGFEAVYSDLEFVIFEDDGVFVEFDDGSDMRFDFLYKLVPWEFIMFEEPELLEILHRLQMGDYIYIMNPAYTALMQSKATLVHLYEFFGSENEIILPASFQKDIFKNLSYVEKVTFGRMGENINIFDAHEDLIESNDGDFGEFPKIYQKFTPLYSDEEFNYYQAGVFVTQGKSCSLSFRRSEGMIVNDDAEFLPHFMPR